MNLSKTFYDELKSDECGRFRSWEHCYFHFVKSRNIKNPDYDYLCLQLSFYLASWGMYRGSSFLLQKDYKIHMPVVMELLKPQYDVLAGIDCSELKKEENLLLLDKISAFLVEYYDGVRKEIKNENIKYEISKTLITKILMGTLGCVPAYDRFFIEAIKKLHVSTGNYNRKSILKLIDFYEVNNSKLEELRNTMRINKMLYPQMKVLDMGFWKYGYDLES